MKAFGLLLAALSCSNFALAQDGNDRQGREIQQGKLVYEYWCATCHGTGLGLPGFDALPGTQQLGLKYRGTNISPLLEERTDLVPEFVKVIVRQGVSFMPHFRKTEISDADLDALTAYLTRNNPSAR
jgi:mono/diheme cytochrome c family protein